MPVFKKINEKLYLIIFGITFKFIKFPPISNLEIFELYIIEFNK
jgi:hypothetical protein